MTGATVSRAIVLSHRSVAHELGTLGEWLTGMGFAVERLHREDAPAIPDGDLLVVLGSPGSAAAGFLTRENEVEVTQVREWVESGRPYLGICFGAQVLALATGGTVTRMDAIERGWMTVDAVDPVVPSGPWMVWHEDSFTAPGTALVRARSSLSEQVFSYRRAWGVQFHLELDSGSLERMAVALGAAPPDYSSLVELMAADEAGHRQRALEVFDAFWADVHD